METRLAQKRTIDVQKNLTREVQVREMQEREMQEREMQEGDDVSTVFKKWGKKSPAIFAGLFSVIQNA